MFLNYFYHVICLEQCAHVNLSVLLCLQCLTIAPLPVSTVFHFYVDYIHGQKTKYYMGLVINPTSQLRLASFYHSYPVTSEIGHQGSTGLPNTVILNCIGTPEGAEC